jgi:predicted nucleic acid-binding protein
VSPVVVDASAGVEMLARSPVGRALARRVPKGSTLWVPDGLFDIEVLAVLRRWDLNSIHTPEQTAACFLRLTTWRLRRAAVVDLRDAAWQFRANITITDGCYVVLAQRLGAPLLTSDLKLAAAPTLPVATITP